MMPSTSTKDDPDLSPTSPVDDSDAILSPVAEMEPVPGLNGVPVRCTWHYTPQDTNVSLYYMKILTLSVSFSFFFSDRVRCMWTPPQPFNFPGSTFCFFFLLHLGRSSGTLHTHNTLSRKTWYECGVNNFRLERTFFFAAISDIFL